LSTLYSHISKFYGINQIQLAINYYWMC